MNDIEQKAYDLWVEMLHGKDTREALMQLLEILGGIA